MSIYRRPFHSATPRAAFFLLVGLLVLLWLAGGASRADVIGQALVRVGACGLLALGCVTASRPRLGSAIPVVLLLAATLLIVLAQLISLPPESWGALPGRGELARAMGDIAVWRPIAIVPDGAVNAAASLIVPSAVLLLATASTPADRELLPAVVLFAIAASMLFGLMQFSGIYVDNPLINDGTGVSGTFANRNHFALFMALGCLVAPFWALTGAEQSAWRGPLALGLVVLFLLLILASGSRTGMLLGVLGLGIGLLLVWPRLRRVMRRTPRWVLPAATVAMLVIVGVFVTLAVAADRASAVSRAVALDVGQDMRARALPTVLAMTRSYFPVGSGFGSFEPLFRMHEPFALLQLTYFNHAHNDFIEVVLEGGFAAALLLGAALAWWVYAGIRVWRSTSTAPVLLGRLGWSFLLLILIASFVDYPARTPMIMAMTVLAGLWLSWGTKAVSRAAALPHVS